MSDFAMSDERKQVDYMSEAHSIFLNQIEKDNLGLCPHCESDTDNLELLMIDRHGFIACHKCKYYWAVGKPTYYWIAEGTTDTWLLSFKLLQNYKQVVPFYHRGLETLYATATS